MIHDSSIISFRTYILNVHLTYEYLLFFFFYFFFFFFFFFSFPLSSGDVDELELSEKELRIVEDEVERRMAPVRRSMEEEAEGYREQINQMSEEKEAEEAKNDNGKKKKK